MERFIGMLVLVVLGAPARDERGLSQSTENAVLLAGAITVSSIVIGAVTVYVRANMPH